MKAQRIFLILALLPLMIVAQLGCGSKSPTSPAKPSLYLEQGSDIVPGVFLATSGGFDYPVNSASYAPGSYGGRSFFYDGVHLGEDIKLPEGTPIRAIGPGKIIHYGSASGYGELVVVIEHELPESRSFTFAVGDSKTVTTRFFCSVYGHLRMQPTSDAPALSFTAGQAISGGTIIGYVNDDKHNGDGAEHLHMGIRLTAHPGSWAYYGYSRPETYPLSSVSYFAAFSELLPQLSQTGGSNGCPDSVSVPSGNWKGEYFQNKLLEGPPAFVRDDGNRFLNFSWGSNGPHTCIGNDNFSVRWTRIVNFNSGSYTFNVSSDDGFRIYLDGAVFYNRWFDQKANYTFTRTLTAGNHTLVMEYYDGVGKAMARLSWSATPKPVPGPTPNPPTPTPGVCRLGFLKGLDDNCDPGGIDCPCATATNHGQYVSCVAQATKDLRGQRNITSSQANCINRAASQSNCGKRPGATQPDFDACLRSTPTPATPTPVTPTPVTPTPATPTPVTPTPVTPTPVTFTLTDIDPNTIVKNTTPTFTITGTGIQPGFTATLINELTQEFPVISTEYISSSTIKVTAAIGAGLTSFQTIRITNPDTQSASIIFTALGAPIITNISPNPVTKGTTPTFTLTGAGFLPGFTATLINELQQEFAVQGTEYVSSTTIKVTAAIGIGPTSTQTIRITNTDGKSASIDFTALAP